MFPQAVMPAHEEARDYGAPSWTTASGQEVEAGSVLGMLAQSTVALTFGGETLTRAFGVEFSLFPGAAGLRAKAAASPRGMRWYHKASAFGFMPDRMAMGGTDIMTRYQTGLGPVLRRDGWLQKKYPGVESFSATVNDAYVGNMAGIYDAWKKHGIDPTSRHGEVLDDIRGAMQTGRTSTGRRAPTGWFARRDHLHKVARGHLMPINTVSGRGPGYGRAVRAVASLEHTAMLTRGLGDIAVGVGVAMLIQGVADAVGGVGIAAHERGKNSLLKSKANTLGVVQTPMSETLRMKALQDAAMSFGAMRAAIGNEAMAYHRF